VAAVWEYVPFILGGVKYTVVIALVGLAVALAVGVTVGLLRLSDHKALRVGSLMFVEFFRGTSEVVQLYWIFFALPLLLALRLPPVTAAIIVLGLNQGAYVAEIVRGAVQAVPRAQLEATVALNMSPWVRMRRVIFPQAVAAMLPSLGNSAVDIAKATSIASLITVSDLTFRAQQVRAVTGESLIVYSFTLVLYLVLTSGLTLAFKLLERQLPSGLRTRAGRA
jgi:polar amino acid transport system permease protein